MGVNKTPDGRTEVGRGIENGNHYKGFATKREIMIQLTEDGATAESLDALEYLKTYALYHGAQGEPVIPPTTRVFISNNGTTKAVEADEITITDSGINIGGCVWNGEAWDFSGAGQGGGGGSDLPEVTADDKDKYLHTNSSTGALEWSAVSGGGGSSLPSTETASAGDVLSLDDNKEPQWAAPSGGGGGALVVNVTETEINENYLYTCDKTASEILSALEEKAVIFKYENGYIESCVGGGQNIDGYQFVRGGTSAGDAQFTASAITDYPYYYD